MRAANALAGPSDASTDTGHRPRSGPTWGYLEIADTTDSAPKRRVNLRGYLPYLLGCTSGDQPLSEAMMTCLGGDFVPVPLPAMHGHRSGGALLLEWNGRVDSLRGFNATSFLGEDGEEEGVVYINDNPAVAWQIMSLPHGARIVITQLIRSHYEVIKQIGHGAFSAVYYVKDVRDGYCYALKTPRRTIASILAAASQEVMALMAPPHPNVCRMFQCDYGTDMKSCDMILEYIHGIPIHRFVSECGFVPDAQARHLAFQLCVGLRHMHKEGISHGDIKGDVGRSDQCSFILLRRSQNVLVTLNEVGQPLIKIIDFGLARVKGNLNSLLVSGGLLPLVSSLTIAVVAIQDMLHSSRGRPPVSRPGWQCFLCTDPAVGQLGFGPPGLLHSGGNLPVLQARSVHDGDRRGQLARVAGKAWCRTSSCCVRSQAAVHRSKRTAPDLQLAGRAVVLRLPS
ncbi:unnamed protein product [Mycena citricolor]|uniref:Protein kinase domain-containing protein n=1 Tax=Mycena citricolor TaxID=2018698 RepID=A0AAD2GXH2_9AGAR|nr:unnamed protein product [Mycena citricolor]